MKVLSDEARLLEAILFVENEPVSYEKLITMTKLDGNQVTKGLEEIKDFFEENHHGLELIERKGRYNFIPRKDLHEKVKDAYGTKVRNRMQKSAMETLAIIAYQQPITKKEIAKFRGLNSDQMVELLLEREYIVKLSRRSCPGTPWQYGTSKKFLAQFNLHSLNELPELNPVDAKRFEKEVEETEDEDFEHEFDDIDYE